jgi:hypothetical protein
MPQARILGQNIVMEVIEGGVPVFAIDSVRSGEVTFQLETLTEGYLGESTDRKDEIFRGVSGRLELHFGTAELLQFAVRLIERAAKREPGVRINVKMTLQFPNGERARILVRNVFFGNIPVGFGSRTDYGSVSLDFESGDRPSVI